jgi:hypothetical protein
MKTDLPLQAGEQFLPEHLPKTGVRLHGLMVKPT